MLCTYYFIINSNGEYVLGLYSVLLYDVADTQHEFNARESDWGFTSFLPLTDLYDPSKGYLVNDTVVVEAEVVLTSG